MYPKKRFGQNFLTDKKILQDLVISADVFVTNMDLSFLARVVFPDPGRPVIHIIILKIS